MSGGTVLCSVVNDGFTPGFVVMERSLRETNPDWDFPIRVIHSSLNPLSEQSIAVIEDHCDNVEFVLADDRMLRPIHTYAREVIKTPERLFPAFSILEAFQWSDADQVIALDSDMIILGSLEPLRHAVRPFNACRARMTIGNEPAGFFNTGVMVLNRSLLQGFHLWDIPTMLGGRKPKRGTGKADQAILNILFRNEFVGYLPQRFNYTKRSLQFDLERSEIQLPATTDEIRDFMAARDTRVFHFVGEKPWNPKIKYSELEHEAAEQIWHDAVYRYGKPSLFALLEQLRRQWQKRLVAAVRQSRAEKPGLVDEAKLNVGMGM